MQVSAPRGATLGPGHGDDVGVGSWLDPLVHHDVHELALVSDVGARFQSMRWWFTPDVTSWAKTADEVIGLREKLWVVDSLGALWLRKKATFVACDGARDRSLQPRTRSTLRLWCCLRPMLYLGD